MDREGKSGWYRIYTGILLEDNPISLNYDRKGGHQEFRRLQDLD